MMTSGDRDGLEVKGEDAHPNARKKKGGRIIRKHRRISTRRRRKRMMSKLEAPGETTLAWLVLDRVSLDT